MRVAVLGAGLVGGPMAVDLARILGKIHQQDVIHLDLNSKNILIGNKQGAAHIEKKRFSGKNWVKS